MIERRVIEFSSTVDGTGPLYAEAVWDNSLKNLPVVAVMCGYHGTRENVASTVRRLAEKKLCAVGIDMRGRGRSAGTPDSGAVEIHDIIDGLTAVCGQLASWVDPERWNIVGYSGGGGNVFSAITKFPDRFQVAAAFFGISDYEYWHRSEGRADCNRTMEKWIGGTPDQVPEKYKARNSAFAAGNCLKTEVHIFWDEQEADCPGRMNEIFAENATQAGHQHVICHKSKVTDKHRWYHGYEDDHADLIAAQDLFVPRMLERNVDLSLPPTGRLKVAGYVETRNFKFWLGNGKAGAAEITYNLDPNRT